MQHEPRATLFPYTTLFRSAEVGRAQKRRTHKGTRARCHDHGTHPRIVELLTGLGLGERGCLRSEEHTSELQSLRHFVCRLLLEKKNAGRLSNLMILNSVSE